MDILKQQMQPYSLLSLESNTRLPLLSKALSNTKISIMSLLLLVIMNVAFRFLIWFIVMFGYRFYIFKYCI